MRATIDEIMTAAIGDRQATIALLRENGYYRRSRVGPPPQAAQRLVRDSFDREMMTSAERRLFDAEYRLAYYRKTGQLPRTIGANSADRAITGMPASEAEIAALEDTVDRLRNAALTSRSGSLVRLATELEGKSFDELESARAAAVAGRRQARNTAKSAAAKNAGAGSSRTVSREPATAGSGRGGRKGGAGTGSGTGGANFDRDREWFDDDPQVPKIDERLLDIIMRGQSGTTRGGHGYGMTPEGKKTGNHEVPAWWTDQDTVDAYNGALRQLRQDFPRDREVRIDYTHRGVTWRLRFSPHAPDVMESVHFYPRSGEGVTLVRNGRRRKL